MRKAIVLAIVSVLLVSGVASANYMDGNKLLQLKQLSETVGVASVTAYALGVYDSWELISNLQGDNGPKRPALPSTVTAGQLGDIVTKYIEDHPEKRHLEGAVLVMLAIGQAFPARE